MHKATEPPPPDRVPKDIGSKVLVEIGDLGRRESGPEGQCQDPSRRRACDQIEVVRDAHAQVLLEAGEQSRL